jgi:hypothetical protein
MKTENLHPASHTIPPGFRDAGAFRKRGGKALVACGGVLLAAAAADRMVLGAAPGLAAPEVSAVSLEYTETPYPIINRGFPVTSLHAPFAKEPAFGRDRIVRGALMFGGTGARWRPSAGGQPSQSLAFAWDTTAGRLYLDLNGNGDLTDDPAGVFTRSAASISSYYQSFTNIHFNLGAKEGRYPVLLDLTLNGFGGQIGAVAGIRSFWQARVSLTGRDWQFGIIENIDQSVGSAKDALLLVRPWESRSETIAPIDASAEAFPFAGNLFLQDRAYRLDCAYQAQAGKSAYSLRLQEQPAKLGELQLGGKFLRRVLLTGKPYVVVLDSPGPLVRVPVGSYSHQVQLRVGNAEAVLDTPFASLGIGQPPRSLVISDGKRATLAAGGPLTNSVAAHPQGKYLVLDYRLLGADGRSYRLLNQDRTKPPRFEIYRKGKEVASGDFQFG